MTLISTTTLSGATTTLSSIPGTYKNLQLIVSGVTGNTSDKEVRILVNNSTSQSFTGVIDGAAARFQNQILLTGGSPTARADANNAWVVNFFNYASTTTYKPFFYTGFFNTTGAAAREVIFGGAYKANTAITSLVLDYEGTNTFAGGTVLLYGMS